MAKFNLINDNMIPENFIEFIHDSKNVNLIWLMDKWFTQRTEEQDVDALLKMCDVFSIFCSISAQEIASFKEMLFMRSGKDFNA